MSLPHQYEQILDKNELSLYLDISNDDNSSDILYILYSDFIDTLYELDNTLKMVIKTDIDPNASSNIYMLCHKIKSSALTIGAFKLAAELITLQKMNTPGNRNNFNIFAVLTQINRVIDIANITKKEVLKHIENIIAKDIL